MYGCICASSIVLNRYTQRHTKNYRSSIDAFCSFWFFFLIVVLYGIVLCCVVMARASKFHGNDPIVICLPASLIACCRLFPRVFVRLCLCWRFVRTKQHTQRASSLCCSQNYNHDTRDPMKCEAIVLFGSNAGKRKVRNKGKARHVTSRHVMSRHVTAKHAMTRHPGNRSSNSTRYRLSVQ
mmetsp:Transcript_5945/g.12494  ORF Transcript_5945/g.12494 Transcript_5945/m.12494 type:complete len:181 (-) Transcript_5945:1502-2044(-)